MSIVDRRSARLSKSPRLRRQLRCEPLESRRMLSVNSLLEDGILTIHGTAEADQIVARVDGEDLIISVNDASVSLPSASVNHLQIFAEAGNDSIVILDSVVQTT